MPLTDPILWKLIEGWILPYWDEVDHGVSPPRRSRRFEDSLRKAGDWTDTASEEITFAYRRFLYLKALSGETLTPPAWIDTAWHHHLSFPTNYSALEARTGRKIAHNQRLTGKKRNAAWDRGRVLWAAEFDAEPPLHIWPPRPARWRLYAGIGVFVGGTIVLFLPTAWGGEISEWHSSAWLVSCLVAYFFIATPQPDIVSHCG